MLKRSADAFEKIGVGSALVGLFQGQRIGILLGMACIVLSYIFIIWETKT